MPGNMRAALIQFRTRRHEGEEAKLPQKFWAFLVINNNYDFYVSKI